MRPWRTARPNRNIGLIKEIKDAAYTYPVRHLPSVMLSQKSIFVFSLMGFVTASPSPTRDFDVGYGYVYSIQQALVSVSSQNQTGATRALCGRSKKYRDFRLELRGLYLPGILHHI
jgi:hypothetical protein